ncbi:MAG: hypothetical protein ACOCRK_05810 [bacterium]
MIFIMKVYNIIIYQIRAQRHYKYIIKNDINYRRRDMGQEKKERGDEHVKKYDFINLR